MNIARKWVAIASQASCQKLGLKTAPPCGAHVDCSHAKDWLDTSGVFGLMMESRAEPDTAAPKLALSFARTGRATAKIAAKIYLTHQVDYAPVVKHIKNISINMVLGA